MIVVAALAGMLMIGAILWDAFETIVLPRRISAQFRLARIVQRTAWWMWAAVARTITRRNPRENFLGLFAMLTMLFLFVVWGLGLMLGFALLHWAAGSHMDAPEGAMGFLTDLYMSGTTFFTLGIGDVFPRTALERLLTVVEAGTGFGYLALVLAYLPVLYQAFSRRESHITMLDEWAGSPPSAAEVLRRCGESHDPQVLSPFLSDWERWSADLLESHLSYPILAYFRSQHDNQSWLTSLTTVLDVCALVMVGVERIPPWQARLTFAMARHAVVDLSQVFRQRPRKDAPARLSADDLVQLRAMLVASGLPLAAGPEAEARLEELRGMYEPYVRALSEYLLMPLPPWLPPANRRYNWQTTAWARTGQSQAH